MSMLLKKTHIIFRITKRQTAWDQQNDADVDGCGSRLVHDHFVLEILLTSSE